VSEKARGPDAERRSDSKVFPALDHGWTVVTRLDICQDGCTLVVKVKFVVNVVVEVRCLACWIEPEVERSTRLLSIGREQLCDS